MTPTLDGGFLLGGISVSDKSGDKSENNKGLLNEWGNPTSDYWVVKIDASGKKVWDKTFGGNNNDQLASLVTATNGDYLFGGTSASDISGDKSQPLRAFEDFWVIRVDGKGNKIWDKTFGGSKDFYIESICDRESEDCERFYFGNSILSSLVATSDGGFLIGGSSNAGKGFEKTEDNTDDQDTYHNKAFKDYWVVKVDRDGNKMWDNTYNGVPGVYYSGMEGNSNYVANSILTSIIATTNGDYILAGYSQSDKGKDKSEDAHQTDDETNDRFDFWLLRIDGNGQVKWDQTIGRYGNDYLSAITKTPDGYLLGGSDFWTVKLQDENYPVPKDTWNMRYGGSGIEGLTTVIKTLDGGYLSGGHSLSGISGDKSQSSQAKNDFWVVKSDVAGKKLWDKRYGGTGDDYLHTLIATSDGGYLLGGSSLSPISGDKTESSRGDRDYWVVKISSTGVKEWDKRFGGTGFDELKKLLQLPSGEYILAGTSNSPAGGDKSQVSQGGQDYWILKISSSGKKIWDKRYGGSLNDALEGLALSLDGGLLLGGNSLSGVSGDKTQASRGGSDYWLVRVDATGKKVWDKRFGGSGEDNLTALGSTYTSTGNFFIAGYSTSGKNGDKTQDSQGGQDFWMLKINGSGTKLWDKRFGANANETLRSIILTSDGGYALGGTSSSNLSGDKSQASQGSTDYWMVKTDANGKLKWDKRYGGNSQEELRALLQTNDGGYLLGGRSDSGVSGDRTQPSQGITDYWLVKVAPETKSMVATREAIETEETYPSFQSLNLTAYPNPATNRVNINFTLHVTQSASLKVFDSQGRELGTLFQGEAKANQKYEVKWEANNHTAGMYLMQLVTPSKVQSQKVLIEK